MMNIGEKIKKLRKERKLTLAKVAGEGLSVGMLSLIENGKAQPSMESLQHIAKQLGIGVSELLQSGHQQEMRALLAEMERFNKEVRKKYNETDIKQLLQHQLDLLEPYMEAGRFNGQSYEEIRLSEMYLNLQYYFNPELDVRLYDPIIAKYEQLHLYSRIVSIYIRISNYAFEKRHYVEAIEVLLRGKHYIEQYGDLINELEKLDFYYHLMIMYAAVNNKESVEQCLNTALDISKEKKIIYRLNDFYRYLFVQHCTDQDREKSLYYLTKIKALASILENPIDQVYVEFLEIMYTNLIEKDYEKVLTQQLTYHHELGEVFFNEIQHILDAEYAYAYYFLEQYEKTIETLANYKFPAYLNHPLDLARCYRTFAVKALAHFKLGDLENAKREILYAMDGVKDYEDLADKRFIIEAYEQITGGN